MDDLDPIRGKNLAWGTEDVEVILWTNVVDDNHISVRVSGEDLAAYFVLTQKEARKLYDRLGWLLDRGVE